MPGLFSSEHLALQFLVPFFKEKRNTFTASYTQIPKTVTLKLRQDGLRNSKIIMELEIQASKGKNFLQQKKLLSLFYGSYVK